MSEKGTKAYMYVTYEGYCYVVFAESESQAKGHIMNSDICDDDSYIDIRVKRCPAVDYFKLPSGAQLDWCNPQHRIAMISKLNVKCSEEDMDECIECPAKDICENYEEIQENDR